MSRRCCISLFVIVLLGAPETSRAAVRQFSMTAMACDGGSPATGSGTFRLDTATGDVIYTISFAKLTPVGVHVHGPADTCTAARIAPVLAGLPVANEISGTFNLSPLLRQLMLDGKLWINVHTDLAPSGEITGRIVLVVPTVSEWGLIVMSLFLALAGAWTIAKRRSKCTTMRSA